MKNDTGYNRRDLLKLLGVGAAGAIAGLPSIVAAQAAATPVAGKRALRIAHLTDVHVQPERGAADGLIQCLHHVQSQAIKPDLIVVTGDCVFDSFGHDRARTQLQWDLWSRILKGECSLPIVPLLGNHDIWGWNKKKSATTGDEAGWGKKWACDALGLAKPYYSVDRGGWHFVMLDSVQPWAERAYTAHIDDEQMAWLKADLAANIGKPTMISSHIPVLSITPIMAQKPEEGLGKNGEPNSLLGHAAMHNDWRELKALFKQHRDVKLAISGHIHLIDRLEYEGISYCCNGAVSGGWWKGAHLGEGDAGYAMIDLYDDGRFDREYVTYGWKYRPDEAAPKG
jgi:3',5'-cyclic-AMP phosphodiesterase